MKNKTNIQSLVMVALFSAILCVSAYISIPLPNGTHITFLNFIVMLIVLMFPLRESVMIVVIWLLLGLIGIPVFVGGNAGTGYLFGLYGGYNMGFLLIAILLPLVRGKKYNRLRYTILSLIGVLLADVVGAAWWMLQGNLTISQAFLLGVLPFMPLDCVKGIVAAQIIPLFRKVMQRNNVPVSKTTEQEKE